MKSIIFTVIDPCVWPENWFTDLPGWVMSRFAWQQKQPYTCIITCAQVSRQSVF